VLLEAGNIGYQIGAAGIVAFSVSFLVVVRWWTDHLGRVIAGVLSAVSGVLIMTTLRMVSPKLVQNSAFLEVRLVLFWAFGLGIWIALGSFLWAQFLAPRIRLTERMTTRKEHHYEEGIAAHPGHDRDGDSDSLSGGHG
jgi:hypothetical protein